MRVAAVARESPTRVRVASPRHRAPHPLSARRRRWHGQRHLVPLLDLINCKEGPDPKRIHSTDWDRNTQSAVTRAGWHFPAGEQVWENYGQPNHIYFMYHGFVLDENVHDCVRHDEALDASHPDSNVRCRRCSWASPRNLTL